METENQNSSEEQAAQIQKNLVMLESMAKSKMSKEAISRYGTIKLARPEMATAVIVAIAKAVQVGQIREELSDLQFKSILEELSKNNNSKFRIKK